MAVLDAIPDMERELKFFSAETTQPQKLTLADIAKFNEKGYIFPINLFTPEETIANRNYFEKLLGMAYEAGLDRYSICWGLTPSKVLTVWIAIDDADMENGAMKVFPGTHVLGRIPFEWVTDEEDGVLNQHVHNPERYGQPVSVELKAGQISLHTEVGDFWPEDESVDDFTELH